MVKKIGLGAISGYIIVGSFFMYVLHIANLIYMLESIIFLYICYQVIRFFVFITPNIGKEKCHGKKRK